MTPRYLKLTFSKKFKTFFFSPNRFRGLDPGQWLPGCYGYNIITAVWGVASIIIW